ncbi:hypothetical protein ASF70_22865 [Rhizobium sp. Leaf321]|uniref:divergent polysaccharide deacetylase family protein n=1 Tax=Rhizobium sp. Leaf321 TaxID=1736335 RepID=UPI000715B76B|nr:divergent polysaccharide deacetylase family protein [Rhizobium sp. Leaf321]KQQ78471.1 hypothetical protein ASF70_22865 [Rhizobium sp. Leaf321]
MGSDLHAPLGQNRPPKRRTARRLSAVAVLGSIGVIAVVGLSIYAMRNDPQLERIASSEPPSSTAIAPKTPADDAVSPENANPNGMPRSNPNSGATIEQNRMADGSVVTKYTPRARDGNGPVLINAQRIGQDPRFAAEPNTSLLEDTEYGKLPILGEDGLRPMDQYARPWSGARGTRIAIVVGGLGLSQTGTQRAIQQLPPGVTLGLAASGNSLQRWMQEARRAGHEIIIQVPFEPYDYPANDPGPGTLLVKDPAAKNLERLHVAMGEITNYTGIMNYQGGRYLSDVKALEPVLRDMASRGLLFLDDGTSAQSKTEVLAKAMQLPHAFGDLTLDGQLQSDAILKKLDELERIAQRKGTAIGIASAFDESIAAIRKWADEASQRGVEIVGVSTLARESVAP